MNKEVFKSTFVSRFLHSLTADQQDFLDRVAVFLQSENTEQVYILRGYAGTGKSRLIATLSQVLPILKMKALLLAPTGRAAKVLSNYAQLPAQTIHRKIYRKELTAQGAVFFGLAPNLHKNTLFIVDEASMIGENMSTEGGMQRSVLEDLLEYVHTGEACKLMLVGDVAQLPPVGSALSPALDKKYLEQKYWLKIMQSELKQVVRQKDVSGILYNATKLRMQLLENPSAFPQLETGVDVIKANGSELEDVLNEAYRKYGYENTLVLCRSNKRANGFNQQIRYRIKWQENELSAGDLMMVVKNNYYWLNEKSGPGFIANGDTVEILKLVKMQEMYGFRFAEVIMKLLDYPDEPDLQATIVIDTLQAESPALTQEQSRRLFEAAMEDYADEPSKGRKFALLKQNPFYNALQVKFSYAVTCHKAQGGQWPCVFIDQGYFTEDMLGEEYLRWLYTAFTRATERVYLVNFSEKFLAH